MPCVLQYIWNGVVCHLKKKQPNLIDFGCMSSENQALKASEVSLPTTTDSFLASIHYFFYLSVK